MGWVSRQQGFRWLWALHFDCWDGRLEFCDARAEDPRTARRLAVTEPKELLLVNEQLRRSNRRWKTLALAALRRPGAHGHRQLFRGFHGTHTS
jgi:hypothetical protein